MNILKPDSAERKILDGMESAITALQAQIKSVQGAPCSLDETRARIRSALDSLTYKDPPGPGLLAFCSADVTYGTLPVFGLAFYVWLRGAEEVTDEIMERLREEAPPAGIPAAERAERLDALSAELRNAETEAEFEALRLEAAGHVVLRRADAAPQVLLAVWAQLDQRALEQAAAQA